MRETRAGGAARRRGRAGVGDERKVIGGPDRIGLWSIKIHLHNTKSKEVFDTHIDTMTPGQRTAEPETPTHMDMRT
jgi:hypothetical protein